MVTIKERYGGKAKPKQQAKGPLWAGPCGEGPQGGITQSLIGRWLCCRERFRLQTVEGWKAVERFSAPLEFGNMWHVCEEMWAGQEQLPLCHVALRRYCEGLTKKFPLQQQEVNDWFQKCAALFPLYVRHWAEHPDVKDRTPLLQEQAFDVPYALPSGRVVRLRGKWDSVDLIGKGREAGIWIQENKTKQTIDRQKIERQCKFDLQTMLYQIALDGCRKQETTTTEHFEGAPILGTRYNVIRRSAHKGGKGKKGQKETAVDSMLKAFEEDRRKRQVSSWFDRWQVTVRPADVERFKRTCLDPILENICDDYEWWEYCHKQHRDPFEFLWRQGCGEFHKHRNRHFRLPFGIYNPLAEGGSSDFDGLLDGGSTVGLHRATDLFPELT